MMNKQTEALKMAIEALERVDRWLQERHMGNLTPLEKDAIQACKEALEQPMINGLTELETNQTMSVKGLSEQQLTRDWKETIDERIAKDDEFKKALEQPASKNIRESFNEMLEDKVAYYKGKQPAQEPVAWMEIKENAGYKEIKVWQEPVSKQSIPLYPHPVPSWKGLSDDEIQDAWYKLYPLDKNNLWDDMMIGKHLDKFAHAIEQALKEKNNV